MIQLHYLGGSSEITPFGNETVRTRSSEEAAPDTSPGDSDTVPGTPVGDAAPPALGPSEDGENRLPNSLCIPSKLGRCRISASLFMLFPCSAIFLILGWLPPSLTQRGPSWTVVRINIQEQRWDPCGELLSLSLQGNCRAWSHGRIVLFFPLHCLCICQVWRPQRQLLSCAREIMWHVPGHVFLQFYDEFCSFWDFP